jgi:hypothetical protein
MAVTFKAPCEQAEWTKPSKKKVTKTIDTQKIDETEKKIGDLTEFEYHKKDENLIDSDKLQLHYNIQLILPNSKDPAVFDALFSSLKRHLL